MSSTKGNNVRPSHLRKVALLVVLLALACVWVVTSGSKTADAQALSNDELVGVSDEVVINASTEPISADEKLEVASAEVPEEMKDSEKRTAVSLVKEDTPKKRVVTTTKSAGKSDGGTSATSGTTTTTTKPVETVVEEKDDSAWSKAKCSWYGVSDNGGSQTASGKKLTNDCMFVAHKTLPFGTKVQFRFNGKTVTGVVQDRGPFIKGRVFDLGPGVARALGFDGVHTVEYRIL